MPAGASVCHRTFPSRPPSAYTRPSSVGAKTTSLATVVQPVAGEPRRRTQSFFPLVAAIATTSPSPVRRSLGASVCTALSRMQRSTTGTKRRPAAYDIGVRTPPQSPGQTVVHATGERAEIVQVRPDRLRPHALARQPVPGDDASRLAGAVHPPPDDDRRGLEVVVAHIVLAHLVVPEKLPGGGAQRHERVCVEGCAGIGAAVRAQARPSPGIGVRDAHVELTVRPERRRVPSAAPAGRGMRPRLADGLETPTHLSVALIERVERPRPPGANPTVETKTSPSAASGAMSMNCSYLETRRRPQTRRPVRRSSANTLVSVAPKIRPGVAASPFGPSFGALVSQRQRIVPVRASRAKTDESSVCAYTVSPAISGVEASAPNDEPPGMWKRHRTVKPATVPEEIDVDAAARVPRTSPFGCSQPPSAAAEPVTMTAAPAAPATRRNAARFVS